MAIKESKLNDKRLHEELKNVFDTVNTMKLKVSSKDEPYIRPSAVPSCAIRVFLKICQGISEGNTWEKEEFFAMDYYTSVGTIAHEVFQRWFGRTGKLIGDWFCLCRGTKTITKVVGRTKVTIEVPKVMKHKTTICNCPKCGKEMSYSELEIDVDGLTGHVDGVIEFEFEGKKCHIVIDYKGTTVEKLKSWKPGHPYITFPDTKHVKQISLYAYALKHYYGLNIVGYGVLYTSRDTPIPKYKICPKFLTKDDWAEIESLFKSQTRQIKILYKTLKDNDITRLLDKKLCKDHSYYRKNVEHKYGACDYSAICFSAPKQMKKLLRDACKCLT